MVYPTSSTSNGWKTKIDRSVSRRSLPLPLPREKSEVVKSKWIFGLNNKVNRKTMIYVIYTIIVFFSVLFEDAWILTLLSGLMIVATQDSVINIASILLLVCSNLIYKPRILKTLYYRLSLLFLAIIIRPDMQGSVLKSAIASMVPVAIWFAPVNEDRPRTESRLSFERMTILYSSVGVMLFCTSPAGPYASFVNGILSTLSLLTIESTDRWFLQPNLSYVLSKMVGILYYLSIAYLGMSSGVSPILLRARMI